jgi:hypothetical protein
MGKINKGWLDVMDVTVWICWLRDTLAFCFLLIFARWGLSPFSLFSIALYDIMLDEMRPF